jgi:hypothetical protein
MKKNILAAFAVLSLAAGAFAQANNYVELTMPTQTVAVGAVTNVLQVIDCTKQASVSVQFTCKQSAAGTNGPIKLVFDRSNDRLKWSTDTKTAVFAATGLTELVGITNIPTHGARFLRFKTLELADSGVITNNTANYAIKVGAP